MKTRDDKIIRSSSHDTKYYFALLAAVKTFELVTEELSDRIELMGESEAITQLHTEAVRIADAIFETFPPEKHQAIARQMNNIYYRIDTARPVNGDKANTLMDVDDLGVLIDFAHKMNCQLCSHPTWCGSRCDLGRTFDRILPESRGKKESWAFIDVTKKDDD